MPAPASPQDDFPIRSVSPSPAAGDIVQPYEINDLRFCEITPAPFTCQRCLLADEQFVRILRYGEDGALYRIYACRPFHRPYVQ